MMEELEMEKKRGEELDVKLKDMEKESFLAQSVDTLDRDQIVIYKERLEEMKKAIYQQADHAAFRFVNDPSQFYVTGGPSSGHHVPPPQMPPPPQRAMMMMPPNMAAPPPQVFHGPMRQEPQMVQDPMMFRGDMMMTSPQPMMTPVQPPPAPPPSPAPEGFQQYEDMGMGENRGGGFY